MSYIVLHMDKFKQNAIRGIQTHNRRERESHSNPDIEYQRSVQNYELHGAAHKNYAKAIQQRIDRLHLTKAVRKDAVRMCGLIVSSDTAFFDALEPKEQRRFFEESKAFLTDFVGKENVISAMVHMDEKTPHMHFLHVPVTKDGRLHANSIYTRESLRRLQADLPAYLQSKGFAIERGVAQEQGSAKKHLNTREYKQQQEKLHEMYMEWRQCAQEMLTAVGETGRLLKRNTFIREQVEHMEALAKQAEKLLREETPLPEASLFNFKSTLEKAKVTIALQRQALATKRILEKKVHDLEQETAKLRKEKRELEASKKQVYDGAVAKVQALEKRIGVLLDRANKLKPFLERPETLALHEQFQAEQERLAKEVAARLEQEEAARLTQEATRLEQEGAQRRALQTPQSQPRTTFRMR